jgi:hypothetical protein
MHGGRMLAVAAVLILVLASHLPPANASAVCSKGSARYTTGSAYETSLGRVADILPTNASSSPDLFAVAAVAAGSNQTVYALGHCRGDLGASSCIACLRAGFKEARGPSALTTWM